MCTTSECSSHAMRRSPPGRVTQHRLLSASPSTPATTTAQAPVPHAKVAPAPLSHTYSHVMNTSRMNIWMLTLQMAWLRDMICTNSTLICVYEETNIIISINKSITALFQATRHLLWKHNVMFYPTPHSLSADVCIYMYL